MLGHQLSIVSDAIRSRAHAAEKLRALDSAWPADFGGRRGEAEG